MARRGPEVIRGGLSGRDDALRTALENASPEQLVHFSQVGARTVRGTMQRLEMHIHLLHLSLVDAVHTRLLLHVVDAFLRDELVDWDVYFARERVLHVYNTFLMAVQRAVGSRVVPAPLEHMPRDARPIEDDQLLLESGSPEELADTRREGAARLREKLDEVVMRQRAVVEAVTEAVRAFMLMSLVTRLLRGEPVDWDATFARPRFDSWFGSVYNSLLEGAQQRVHADLAVLADEAEAAEADGPSALGGAEADEGEEEEEIRVRALAREIEGFPRGAPAA